MSEDFLNIPTEDELPNLKAVAAGEYRLTILGAERKSGVGAKSGKAYDSINVAFAMDDNPDAQNVYKTFFLPSEDSTPKQRAQSLRQLRFFIQAFNLPNEISLNDLDSWSGKSGFAILKLTSDEEYGDKNEVSKFVAGA